MERTLTKAQRARKNYNDRVRRANKKFAEASPAEKRVIVAQDVLLQLRIGKIKATPGKYLDVDSVVEKILDIAQSDPEWNDDVTKTDVKKAKNTELCDLFKAQKSCDACALGSVFVSAVQFQDKLKVKDVLDDDGEFCGNVGSSSGMYEYLKGIFDLKQLYMIENAFEMSTINTLYKEGHGEECRCTRATYGNYFFCNGKDVVLEEKCVDFALHIESPRKRLEKIMQNIIDNEGNFVP